MLMNFGLSHLVGDGQKSSPHTYLPQVNIIKPSIKKRAVELSTVSLPHKGVTK